MLIFDFRCFRRRKTNGILTAFTGEKTTADFTLVRVKKAAVNTNQGKASLHAVSVCRRSGRRRCCGRVFRWRQRRGSRRGWVSRPERTKFSIGAGDVSPTRNRLVAMSKTHFAALLPHLPSLRIHNRNFIAFPMSVCFHSDAPLGQSGAEQTILRHGFCRATSFQKEVSVLLKSDVNCFVKSSFRKELSNVVRLRIDKLRNKTADEQSSPQNIL